MPQTETRVIVYSSNVSDKTKGYDILLECLRQKQELSWTPRIPQTKHKGYAILLDVLILGVHHNPSVLVRTSRSMSYPLFLSETFEEYIIPLVFLRHSTKTRVMVYSSNVSDKNKRYGILLECLRQKQGLWYTHRMSQTKSRGMIYSSNVSDKYKGYGILLECGVYHNPCFCRRHSKSIPYSFFCLEHSRSIPYHLFIL
jgi:hypothetical protein